MALSVAVRTVDGGVAGTVALDETIFGIRPNVAVLHQVVTAQLAAARSGTQSTKTRAEVRGGGKKPFKQKGTGRARQGSTRAPHWVGGGVTHAPKPRSYRQKTPRKMIQLALRSALSDRAAESRVAIVAEWPWTAAKTRDAKAALVALDLAGRVLVVVDRESDEQTFLAFRNLPDVQLILSGELNAYDVLCNDWVVFTRRTLPGTTAEIEAETEAAAMHDDPAGDAGDTSPILEAPAVDAGDASPPPGGAGALDPSGGFDAPDPSGGSDVPDPSAGSDRSAQEQP
jgi:large subunit ribosomal protein L4